LFEGDRRRAGGIAAPVPVIAVLRALRLFACGGSTPSKPSLAADSGDRQPVITGTIARPLRIVEPAVASHLYSRRRCARKSHLAREFTHQRPYCRDDPVNLF